MSNPMYISGFLRSTSLMMLLVVRVTVASNQLVPPEFKGIEGHPKLPDGYFLAETGDTVTLNSLRGKILILHFWATWCGPCLKELPALSRLSKSLSPDRYQIVEISADAGGSSRIRQFLDQHSLSDITAASDPSGRLRRQLAVRGLPTTFVADQNGALLWKAEGAQDWDSPNVIQFFDANPLIP